MRSYGHSNRTSVMTGTGIAVIILSQPSVAAAHLFIYLSEPISRLYDDGTVVTSR